MCVCMNHVTGALTWALTGRGARSLPHLPGASAPAATFRPRDARRHALPCIVTTRRALAPPSQACGDGVHAQAAPEEAEQDGQGGDAARSPTRRRPARAAVWRHAVRHLPRRLRAGQGASGAGAVRRALAHPRTHRLGRLTRRERRTHTPQRPRVLARHARADRCPCAHPHSTRAAAAAAVACWPMADAICAAGRWRRRRARVRAASRRRRRERSCAMSSTRRARRRRRWRRPTRRCSPRRRGVC